MVQGKLDIHMQKNEATPLPPTIYKKINSKWIQDLEMRPETTKLLEGNVGEILQGMGMARIFWIGSLKALERKTKIVKWDYINLKMGHDKINRVKSQLTECEKKFAKYASDKSLITRMHKELNSHPRR
jgi:hypothetical protein